MHPTALLPEIALLIGAVSCLIGGSFTPRRRQWRVRLVAVAALAVAGGAAVAGLITPARTVYTGTFAVDTATGVARLIVIASTLLVIGLGVDEIADTARESETYALLLLSSTGVCVLAGADDLLVLTVGFLLTSIPLYGLIGLPRTPAAAEAVMKTYLLGALLGVTMLLGVAVLYGLAGTTSYAGLADALPGVAPAVVAVGAVAVLAGLVFEAGAIPGHFWVPDAAQGSTTTAAAYLTTVTKVGAVVAIYRLVAALPGGLDWSVLIGVLAVASMTLGNLAAYGQDDARRLLGWSTVSQVGYPPGRGSGFRPLRPGLPRPAALPRRLRGDQPRGLRGARRAAPPPFAGRLHRPGPRPPVAGRGAGGRPPGPGGHPTDRGVHREARRRLSGVGRRGGVAGGRAGGQLRSVAVLLPALARTGVPVR